MSIETNKIETNKDKVQDEDQKRVQLPAIAVLVPYTNTHKSCKKKSYILKHLLDRTTLRLCYNDKCPLYNTTKEPTALHHVGVTKCIVEWSPCVDFLCPNTQRHIWSSNCVGNRINSAFVCTFDKCIIKGPHVKGSTIYRKRFGRFISCSEQCRDDECKIDQRKKDRFSKHSCLYDAKYGCSSVHVEPLLPVNLEFSKRFETTKYDAELLHMPPECDMLKNGLSLEVTRYLPPTSESMLVEWCKDVKMSNFKKIGLNICISYSRVGVDWSLVNQSFDPICLDITDVHLEMYKERIVVLRFESKLLNERWEYLKSIGCVSDYSETLEPFIALSYNAPKFSIHTPLPEIKTIQLYPEYIGEVHGKFSNNFGHYNYSP
jgi:hypothetical protein